MPTYNPYGEMTNWYGVPDYGSAYNTHMNQSMAPLPLSHIQRMVADLQRSTMGRQLGNQSVNISPTMQSEIPGQIADSVMNTQNRLLSLPRSRFQQNLASDPSIIFPPNEPAGTAPGATAPSNTSGGGGYTAPRTSDRSKANYNPYTSPSQNPGGGLTPGGGTSPSTSPTITNYGVTKQTPTFSQPRGYNPFGSSLATRFSPGGGGGGGAR